MIKIIGNRGSGKTFELIKISSDRKIPILCLNNSARLKLKEKSKIYGINIPEPLLLTDYLKDDTGEKQVLIEDVSKWAELLLNATYGLNIAGYTESLGDLTDEVIKLGY